MKKRQLGTSELLVNEIGYGSMNLALDKHKRPSEQDAVTLLQQAVDEFGVELIDTADVYCAGEDDIGYCERLLAKALQGERRERVVITTKGGFTRPGGRWVPNGQPAHLRAACEASLKALDTDRIDLYQLHRSDPAVPIEESLGALVDLQREGKIRHIGVSNFSLDQLRRAMEIATIVSLENPLFLFIYDKQSEEFLHFCEKRSISWLAYAPVGGHRGAQRLADYADWMSENIQTYSGSPYSMALAWLLHSSSAVIPIPATTNIRHLSENMRAADIQLSVEDREKMTGAKSWMEYHSEAKDNHHYGLAIEYLQKQLAKKPNDAIVWYNLACAYALNGESDESLDALDSAIEKGFTDISHLKEDGDLEMIRPDPRYAAALQRLGH